MLAYRLTHAKYAEDISGFGAYKVGGRWNPKGNYALYLAEHPAGAILEALIHMPPQLFPDNFVMVICQIENKTQITRVEETELPSQWREGKYTLNIFQSFGRSRLFDEGYLGMIIPSSVAYPSCNFVLNCLHEKYHSLHLGD